MTERNSYADNATKRMVTRDEHSDTESIINSGRLTEQEQLSQAYSDLKDKHVALQKKYQSLYKRFKLYEAQVMDNEHVQKLETILISHNLMGELEVMTTNRWVSGRRFSEMKEERDNYAKWYWEAKDSLNELIRGRQCPEEEKL